MSVSPLFTRLPVLLFSTALFLTLSGNLLFFHKLYALYPADWHFLLSVTGVLLSVNWLLLTVLCHGRASKPVLILLLILAASSAYFMDSYQVVIDQQMIANAAQTDQAEARDLLTPKLMIYLLVLGLLPAWLVYRWPITPQRLSRQLLGTGLALIVCLSISAGLILLNSDQYAAFFRQHKAVRYYANPAYPLYSGWKYVASQFATSADQPVAVIGADAYIPESDVDRELIIVVVGETARADHFALNGYPRDTNPYLTQIAKRDILVSFRSATSCGTSTAYSVPCMFSGLDREHYSPSRGGQSENVLDIIQRTGAHVLWLDNNSSSKGVADRVAYQSYKSADVNPECDIECRDAGMLSHLQHYIDSHPQGDIVIVLHQMGNHGPAYYKRYPAAFAQFTPVCTSSQLEQCSREQIINSYDNALRYTDYFLSQAIALLKRNDAHFETALLYASDHGESLGESNIYLHGLPYLIAPAEQTHIPFIIWLGQAFSHEVDIERLRGMATQPISHDHIFHTLLGLLEINSGVYQPALDLLEHQE